MSETRRDIVFQAVRDTAAECGATKAIVFGSFARADQSRHSDIDAVFVEKTERRFLDRPDRYISGIYGRIGIPADVFVYTPEEFDSMATASFLRRVLREGVVVYER